MSDAQAAKQWEEYLDGVRKAGSAAARIEVVASGVPVGWGAPGYGKLDTDLAAAMMSINAVKGVEIGNGFAAAALSGEENADEMTKKGFTSNMPVAYWAAFPPAKMSSRLPSNRLRRF